MRKGIVLPIALLLVVVALQPAIAAAPAQIHFDFSLDKREAAKDEPVVARYQLTQPAKRVFITASDAEGGPLSFSFPQTRTTNAGRTSGIITFTVPISAGTLSPLRMTLNVDGQLRGMNLLRIACDHPWFFEPRPDRCLFAPAIGTPAAIQSFEHGTMVWLQSTRTIWVLYANQRVDRFDDLFLEGMPEFDARFSPPSSQLLQPIRGFGQVWREHDTVRSRLGWALAPERGYTACAGDAFGGTRNLHTFITTPDTQVIEIATHTAPYAWRTVQPATIQPCG